MSSKPKPRRALARLLEPSFVSLCGGALALNLLLVGGLVSVLAREALPCFWPRDLVALTLWDGTRLLGEVHEREEIPASRRRERAGSRLRLRVGNRDLGGPEFLWIDESEIADRSFPPDAALIERLEWGGFHGTIVETRPSEEGESVVVEAADGTRKAIPAAQIVRVLHPNRMGLLARLGLYLERLREFLFEPPRESNTEGGLYPAIVGTVLLVFLMSFAVMPLGVLAALYLREYARQGTLVRLVRIAVHNLAGVPSIVFGLFGLGFFVYLVGGAADRLFYADALPQPTFGKGGLLWASLTLALLTVPVVIVAAEEGLAAVPRAAREGSMALGATKLETTWRVVLPAAAPGILTGMILAMARAAGEVAPLMIVGVAKMAPALPIDGEFPFLHPSRKIMHLGFHIYDIGFQSPNVEALKPRVFATALLLLAVVTAMNVVAIVVRNRLRQKTATSAV